LLETVHQGSSGLKLPYRALDAAGENEWPRDRHDGG
jgi:hypothetical protein